MAASFIISMFLEFVAFKDWPNADPLRFAWTVLITVVCTTIIWITVTLLTPAEDESVLLAFYRRVQPNASLWGPIRKLAPEVAPPTDGMANLRDWALGCLMIYMFLFGVGKIIFGDTPAGLIFIAIGVVAGIVIYVDLQRRGWNIVGQDAEAAETK
jgi:hypothetical protein